MHVFWEHGMPLFFWRLCVCVSVAWKRIRVQWTVLAAGLRGRKWDFQFKLTRKCIKSTASHSLSQPDTTMQSLFACVRIWNQNAKRFCISSECRARTFDAAFQTVARSWMCEIGWVRSRSGDYCENGEMTFGKHDCMEWHKFLMNPKILDRLFL